MVSPLSASARAERLRRGQLVEPADVAMRQHHRFERPDRPERHQHGEVVVPEDDPLAGLRFEPEIVAEQARAMGGAVVGLRGELLGGFVGQVAARPDLTVRVRVAGAHRGAAILEDLHRVDLVHGAERHILLAPAGDHMGDVVDGEASHRKVVAGGIADHPADTGFGAGDDQSAAVDRVMADARLQGREVVVEDEGVGVVGIAVAVRAPVARAEVAVRVVGERRRCRRPLGLADPRPLVAVRRDQHPFAGQRVEPTMRDALGRQHRLSLTPLGRVAVDEGVSLPGATAGAGVTFRPKRLSRDRTDAGTGRGGEDDRAPVRSRPDRPGVNRRLEPLDRTGLDQADRAAAETAAGHARTEDARDGGDSIRPCGRPRAR